MVVVQVCGDLTLVCVAGSLLVNDRRTSETKIIDVFSNNNNNKNNKDGQTDKQTDASGKKEEEEEEEEDVKERNGGKCDKKGIEEEEEDGRGEDEEREEEKIDKKEEKEENNRDTENQTILTASFCPDGQWLALGCGWKALEVWSVPDWRRVVRHPLVKKPTATVVNCGWVYVADKAGDVYKYPLPSSSSSSSSSSKEDSRPILGHLSMLLDLTITPDNKFIMTCDRDEKIRVSIASRPFEIHSFLLGHREFVTQVSVVSAAPPRLLSSSGDGTLKLWDYDNGKLLSSLDTSSLSSSFLRPLEVEEGDQGGVGGGKDCPTPPPQHPTPTPPPVPAVRGFAVRELPSSDHLVAFVVDRAAAIFLCQLREDSLTHLSTTRLPTIPLAAKWRSGDELVVVEEGAGIEVLRRGEEDMTRVEEEEEKSGLMQFVKQSGGWWGGAPISSSLGHLYKQRYDNVSRYLEKKKERMLTEEAFQQGQGPPPKKGRWLK